MRHSCIEIEVNSLLIAFFLQEDKGAWTIVFTLAACVHLFGITFYGIFASGELQSWAEPVMEEQQAWDPMSQGQDQETSFVS